MSYSVHEDWQNTVWALSNTSAVVVERYEQDDPFGKSHTLDASGNNLGNFASQVYHHKRILGTSGCDPLPIPPVPPGKKPKDLRLRGVLYVYEFLRGTIGRRWEKGTDIQELEECKGECWDQFKESFKTCDMYYKKWIDGDDFHEWNSHEVFKSNSQQQFSRQ